ncbi:MAG: virulence RhuM family protein [Ignavibacteriaceae bacterium]|nr:virulence RhuM family protein [Ignavibacteriaceae bacterium]
MSESEIILYTSEDGTVNIHVHLEDETVWLTQEQIANLFGKARNTITEHIKNIFSEGELDEKVVCREIRHTTKHGAIEGKFQRVTSKYYNLDVIISVGYRVKSVQGTRFRQWATKRIHEYIVKGFTIDDNRLKQEGGRSRYFEELLQRVRDIRSSERNFYEKIKAIYATSVDYNRDDKLTSEFFATVQNKMHYAVHGRTAAELINERADSKKAMMGLTNFSGSYITQRDIGIAKNYLNEDELKQLNLIVSMYLDFAELQALNKKTMRMRDWVKKLDDFLKISDKDILGNPGKISHEAALKKARAEYQKFRAEEDKKYISDLDNEVKKLTDQGRSK